MAFDYMRQCAQVSYSLYHVMIHWCSCVLQSVALFAYESEEIGGGGKRRYLVATYLTFVNRYL